MSSTGTGQWMLTPCGWCARKPISEAELRRWATIEIPDSEEWEKQTGFIFIFPHITVCSIECLKLLSYELYLYKRRDNPQKEAVQDV